MDFERSLGSWGGCRAGCAGPSYGPPSAPDGGPHILLAKTSRTVTGADGKILKGTEISKGRFAQELADVLADPVVEFTVPAYLADAIRITATDSAAGVSAP